ncbi:MAG TPA: copper transporter [Mycobacteriales bacterium]|nr:copper transporter [Mycobacteriales bacterium]
MIDFRYHVVSIIAVFLALGTGIVLGSTALDRPIIDDLKRRTEGLSQDKEEQQEEILQLKDRESQAREFATGVGSVLLPGRLTGQRVTVVLTPSASGDVRDSVLAAVRLAGGRVGGQIRLLPKLIDPAAAGEVDELVAKLATGIDPPSGTVPRAAAQLAAVLDAEGAADTAAVPADTVRVVSGYREAGLIAVEGDGPVRPGDVVLMIAGAPEDERRGSPSPSTSSDPLLDVVTAFAGRGAVVLVGDEEATAEGALLPAVRDDSTLRTRLSTVDSAGTPAGDVVTVLVLADALRRDFGHYGTAPGASAPLPAPEPEPAPA